MNERTYFFIKICISQTLFSKVVCERWVERHILRKRTSSHIFFQEPGGCQRLHPLASSSETPLVSCVSLVWLQFSALSLNLTAWFSSRDLLPVTHLFDPSALIVLSCLLIKMWLLENPWHMLYNTILKVFGMTQPRIEPRSPGTLVNTLPIWPMSRLYNNNNNNNNNNENR